MKKKIIIAGMSMMLCMLCGCLESTPLTDAEMNVVAEYAASLMLKYDSNYESAMYYEEELLALLSPTPMPTATPTPTPAAPEGGALPPIFTPGAVNDKTTNEQLTEIMAVENFTVTYESYETKEEVFSNEYFSLKAKEGKQYVEVKFKLHNNTSEELVFDASENGLEYKLDINVGTVYRASLSMLENDMQYMEIPVPANGSADAVLIFEVSDAEINTAHLIIENETDSSVFIKMK